MSTVTKTSSTPITASVERVWKTLAADFLAISEWAGGVKTSVANPATPDGLNGSPHGGRICDIEGMGLTDERIIAFDEDSRTLTYSVAAEGSPPRVCRSSSTPCRTPGPSSPTEPPRSWRCGCRLSPRGSWVRSVPSRWG